MRRVAIIGGGPAGMMAAFMLADHASVDLYEQGRNLGRKFLVAGEGGLNITNRVDAEALIGNYSPADGLRSSLAAFGSSDLRSWLSSLGISTFEGSSGRVFPVRGLKPITVLNAIIDAVKAKGVRIHSQHRFIGFDEAVLPIVEHGAIRTTIDADHCIFALGGASWSRTGSTGEWAAAFEKIGVRVVPFQPSNCGVEIRMPGGLGPHIGKPLKNIVVRCGARTVRGEITITQHGLEGNAIYPLVPEVRKELQERGEALLVIDLKPDLTEQRIAEKLQDPAWHERMATLRLDRPSVALLKAFTPLEHHLDGRRLAHDVKHVSVPVTALRPIEEAISTVGGIAMDEVDQDLSLKRYPHLFMAGEMLDWDAPTGGFLLQGAFATGRWAAQGVARRSGLAEEV